VPPASRVPVAVVISIFQSLRPLYNPEEQRYAVTRTSQNEVVEQPDNPELAHLAGSGNPGETGTFRSRVAQTQASREGRDRVG
jgi:hypothetical protein